MTWWSLLHADVISSEVRSELGDAEVEAPARQKHRAVPRRARSGACVFLRP